MANFSEVKLKENAEIRELRKLRKWPETSEGIGLALSGGGIRSATFNLGVLQGLATFKLLPRFDYMSTVSGGGYIGSWLISWIKRAGINEVERALAAAPPRNAPPPQNPSASAYVEPKPINFLRDYSNYLTPRVGLLGADTWAAATMIARNLLLNLAIVVCFLAALLLLPHFVQLGFQYLSRCDRTYDLEWMAWPALLLMAGGLGVVTLNLADFSWRECEAETSDPVAADHPAKSPDESSFTDQKWVLMLAAAPIFLAAALGSCCLWFYTAIQGISLDLWCWLLGGALGYFALSFLGTIVGWLLLLLRVGRNNRCLWKKEARYAGLVLVTALGAGAFGGFLVQRLAVVFCHWTKSAPPLLAGLSRVATWGTPLLVLIVLLTGVLHIGLMGLPFVNQRREWWARLSGWLLIGSLAWTLFFAISIYAPFGVIALSGWVKSKTALIGAWVLSTLSGVAAGKSAQTSGKKGANSPLELVAVVAPYVFVAGLLVAISYGIYYLVPPGTPFAVAENRVLRLQPSGHIDVTVAGTGGGSPALTGDIKIAATTSDEENLPSERDHYWERWEGRDKGVQDNSCAGCKAVNPTSATSPSLLARWVEKLLSLCRRNSNPSNRPLLTSIIYWFLGLSVVVLVLAWRVDINEFSMHLLYRNRLVRCYLGASNEARDAQRFTGFDPADDVLLKNFRADKGENYGGPYPIISSTLNVTHGEKLAWQERKAESFVFTPMYCGYEFVEEHDKIPRLFRMASMDGGYCPTESYAYKKGGVYLGTAFAISGAAASPNMGYHTSAALAFLMTIFNVRLGWWLGNPRRGAKEQASPYFSLLYLLFELFANTSDRSQFIYVSDGGHFENLGIYELVRRGCKYIVASDAGADANMKFGDLGNAIRKCRSDFGVEIELNADAIRPATPGETSTAHYAVGTIHYPGTAEEGKLLYIKSSIAGEEPEDVLAYKACHPEFPHQTTADQWFDESQFESYRALGRFVMESALERLGEPDEVKDRSTEDVFNALASH